MTDLQQQFGQIDIYLFDQLLRGRIAPGMRIFDAGCGHGRNLVYLLREGYEVFGADADPRAIDAVRQLARSLAPALPPDNFRAETIEAMSFADAFADVVISSAVLHFARDDQHFDAMLRGTWRVLKPGGLFFCRLASSIGIESQVKRIAGPPIPAAGRFRALSGGRSAIDGAHERTGRKAGGPVEDHRGAEPTLDDHLGAAERLN